MPLAPLFHRPCCPAINLVKEGKGDRSKGGGSAHGGGYGRLHILQYFSQYTDNQGFLKMLFGYDFNLYNLELIWYMTLLILSQSYKITFCSLLYEIGQKDFNKIYSDLSKELILYLLAKVNLLIGG